MSDTWGEAFERTSAAIAGHPSFRRLVREVAVAEQPTGAPARLRLNSRTYGSWWTRGSSWPTRGGKGRRAWRLAELIAADLDVYGGRLPMSECRARVYGEARDYVRARELPRLVDDAPAQSPTRR